MNAPNLHTPPQSPRQRERSNMEAKVLHGACLPKGEKSKLLHETCPANGEDTKMVLLDSFPKSYPMNSGNGPYSYAQNSFYQRIAVETSKDLIAEAIAEKLDINNPSFDPSKPFLIADLGCSTGANTLIAVQNILEAVALKYQQHKTQIPEFQVFFNDHTESDFNTLFKSLPPLHPGYFAAGVPGSFHGRLFPKSSLHIVHSSVAVHWLSKVPKQVADRNSLAWNKGKILYTGNEKEIQEAYAAQYKDDMQAFLSARAQELVGGGLMVLIVMGIPNGALFSQTSAGISFDLLGSCFMDMVNMGLLSEEKVDSFNLPLYYASPEELEDTIKNNGCFHIEKMEKLTNPINHGDSPDFRMSSLHVRAAMEGIIAEHFGNEIIEDLFECFTNKLAENAFIYDEKCLKGVELIVFLRRKITD